MTRRKLPPAVIALGVVSLLTDASSEMILPLLPLFLTEVIGAGVGFVGLIDGLADTTAAFLKLATGAAADRAPAKKPFVVAGYLIASVVRPLVGIATMAWHVLLVRFTDRIGKGIRSSPRDALLAAATPAEDRGRAFGFHRAMDHAGAVLGPLIALVLLRVAGLSYRTIFLLAAIPGALAVFALVAFVREEPVLVKAAPARSLAERFGLSGPALDPRMRRYLIAVALFTLASSSDVFLILKAREVGIAAWLAPLLWIALHLVRALLSTWGGQLSDRIGRGRAIRAGWLIYALAYGALALASEPWHVWALIALYGCSSALYEGAEKALVADLSPDSSRGRSFGLFHFTVGLCALPASLGFGLLWQHVSSRAAFLAGASLALWASALLGWALATRAPTASDPATPS